MPTAAERYLVIPGDYAKDLGGLIWSESGDMIETAAGKPFAWRQQIQQFLEGFASVRRPMHFVHLLHLMQLMGVGPISVAAEPATEMRRSFTLAGKLLRNAGVFIKRVEPETTILPGFIYRHVPRVQELAHQKPPAHIVDAEVPPLDRGPFLEQVFRSAAAIFVRRSIALVQIWLSTGLQCLAACRRRVGKAAAQFNRRTGRRGSQSRATDWGHIALVPSLCGTLALPPRRLDHSELPVGGYADVTTRSQPELRPATQPIRGRWIGVRPTIRREGVALFSPRGAV